MFAFLCIWILTTIIVEKIIEFIRRKRGEERDLKIARFIILLIVVGVTLGVVIRNFRNLLPDRAVYVDSITETYELVSFNSYDQEFSEFKGSMFLLSGSVSGKAGTFQEYRYWYKRSDGGMIPGNITNEEVNIVVYETNEISPRFEIYEGKKVLPEDFKNRALYEFFDLDCIEGGVTEYRFYVPVGTFVNTAKYVIE